MPTRLPTNVVGLDEYLRYVNDITNGVFGPALIFLFGVIIFIQFKQYDNPRAATATTAIMAIVSFIFAVLDIMPRKTMGIFVALFIGSLLWSAFTKRD